MVEATIDSGFTQYAPDKLMGDKAHACDDLDQRSLNKRNVEVKASYCKGRKNPKTQDGRKLKPYRRRWKVELLFCLASKFQAACSSIRTSAMSAQGLRQCRLKTPLKASEPGSPFPRVIIDQAGI